MSTVYQYNVTLTMSVRSTVNPSASRIKLAHDIIDAVHNMTTEELYDFIEEVLLTGDPRAKNLFPRELERSPE